MKLEKVISGVWAAVLSICVSLGCVMCMVTAFDMKVDVTAIVLCCCGAALVSSVCYSLPLGLIPPSVGALTLGYLWQTGQLVDSVEAILNRLTRQYDRAYRWGIIRWGLRTADDMEPTMVVVLCILGAAIAISVCWSVCRGKTVIPGVLLSILGAATCFVVTDTVPDMIWLYLLLLGILVLLLTGKLRHQDAHQGNRLMLWVAPVTALALLILLAAVPKQTYQGQARADKLVDLFLEFDPVELLRGENTNGILGSTEDVDLADVGRRNESDSEILAVTAEFAGVIYLRGRAMNAYDGKSWTDRQRNNEPDWSTLAWPGAMLDRAGMVSITTKFAHRMIYQPYYINAVKMQDITVGQNNTDKLTEYSFLCYTPQEWGLPQYFGQSGVFDSTPTGISDEDKMAALAEYIVLPDSVRSWAEPLAQEITGSEVNVYLRAQAIAEYVRSSAVYDTNTDKMPAGEKDFARWFLESSDTGYCAHFATAATVLLQASGIPARYVTGYMTTAAAGETTPVLAKQAHAWTEYYLPGFGWTVLDATPAAVENDQAPTTETTAPEQTVTPERPDATLPVGGADGPEQVQTDKNKTALIVWLICGALLLAAAAEGQYRLRRYLRKRQFDRSDPNGQTILLWQDVVVLAQMLGEEPGAGLFELAQMAKFSQHTVTPSQQKEFSDYLETAIARLKKKSIFHRIWYRFVMARY